MSSDFAVKLAKTQFQKYCEAQKIPHDDTSFEQFSAYCATRQFSYDQSSFDSGLSGDGGDGGIDWAFLAVDDQLMSLYDEEIEPPFPIKKKTDIKIIFGQSKNSHKWTENVGHKFHSTFSDFFSPENEEEPQLKTQRTYNENINRCMNAIRKFWLDEAASKRPSLSIEVWYTNLSERNAPEGVSEALNLSISPLVRAFRGAEISIKMAGANELFELATEVPSYDSELKYSEKLETETGNIVLATLPEYFSFLTDENQQLKTHLFDQNVRDYQGATGEVNSKIEDSLRNPTDDLDFWWLNNGITILVGDSPISTRGTLTLEDVQIVNGLQTSHTIFNYFSKNKDKLKEDKRLLLIRVLATSDESHRAQIIRSTNSQTPVGADALRGTDPIHRQIEQVLGLHGLYYDRRKNFYKNKGYPQKKIVSIKSLSQSLLSAFLLRPGTARARPNSFLKEDEYYNEIFQNRADSDFVWCAKVDKRVDDQLLKLFRRYSSLRNNVRFYALSLIRILGNYEKKQGSVNEWSIDKCDNNWYPSDDQVSAICSWVANNLTKFAKQQNSTADKVAKSADFLPFLEKQWTGSPEIAKAIQAGKTPEAEAGTHL